MQKFAFFVGNGFSLDFIEPKGLHSSFPLKNFKSHYINYDTDFIDHLPNIKEQLLGSDLNDFNAIKNYVDTFRDVEEEYQELLDTKKYESLNGPKYQIATNMHVELRRFISMAYSVLQLKVNKFDMSEWKWLEWLRENKSRLTFAISLNYDLVLENTLRLAAAPFYRVGTTEFLSRIPVIKPHGSIDFDLPNNFIVTNDPWQIKATLNDAQMVHITPQSNWLTPRIEADIISPSLYNVQTRLSWVKRMFKQYSIIAKDLDAFVIVGCSYWDVDRPEIDFLLSQLKRRTRVCVIDIDPSEDLKRKIQALGLSYKEANTSGLPW